MLGAREYATLFKSGQYGRLYITSGEHARGKTFHIWVLASEEPLLTHPAHSSSAVQVYGIVSGNPGWSETYGWLHRGKWEQDFYDLVEARRAEIAETLEQKEREQKELEAAELGRQAALLASYESPDDSDLKIALRDATVGPAFPENNEAGSTHRSPEMKTIEVRADDLLDLIEQHDCWAGTLDPASAIEWRQKYADLRELAEHAVAESAKHAPL